MQVTVAMAAFNGERFIRDSVLSVLRSTYRDFTLLVMDDASTDSTFRILKSFHDPRIRLVRHEENRGLVATRNEILELAPTDLLFWLDQDDLMYPQRLADQIDVMVRNPSLGIVGSWTMHRRMTPSGNVRLRTVRFPIEQANIRAWNIFTNAFSFNTMAFRLSVLRHAQLKFRPAYGNALDYDLASRAADLLPVMNMPTVLGEYRIHSEQTSQGPGGRQLSASASQIRIDVLRRNFGEEITSLDLAALIDDEAESDSVNNAAELCLRLLELNERHLHYTQDALKLASVHFLCRALWRHPEKLRKGKVREALIKSNFWQYLLHRRWNFA